MSDEDIIEQIDKITKQIEELKRLRIRVLEDNLGFSRRKILDFVIDYTNEIRELEKQLNALQPGAIIEKSEPIMKEPISHGLCDICGNEDKTYVELRYWTGGLKDIVGKPYPLPFTCKHCGGLFCEKHRLPENHKCNVLTSWGKWGAYKHPDTYPLQSLPEYLPHEIRYMPSTTQASPPTKSKKIYRYYSWNYPLKKLYYL